MEIRWCRVLRGSLPWQGLKAASESRKEELILAKKRDTTSKELCRGLPKELVDYFNHIFSLDFDDIPNYNYLRKGFSRLFRRMGFEYDNVCDHQMPMGPSYCHLKGQSSPSESHLKAILVYTPLA